MTESIETRPEQDNFTDKLLEFGSRIDEIIHRNRDQAIINPNIVSRSTEDGSTATVASINTFNENRDFAAYKVSEEESTANGGIKESEETSRCSWDKNDPGNKDHQKKWLKKDKVSGQLTLMGSTGFDQQDIDHIEKIVKAVETEIYRELIRGEA
jgi:hypothetical protein